MSKVNLLNLSHLHISKINRRTANLAHACTINCESFSMGKHVKKGILRWYCLGRRLRRSLCFALVSLQLEKREESWSSLSFLRTIRNKSAHQLSNKIDAYTA